MGRVADLAIGYPGYWGRIPREQRLPVRDPRRARLRAVRRRQVAPDARGRDPHGRAARHRGRSAAASSAGTASTAARRTSSCRRCTTTTTRCAPPRSTAERLPPERRPRRPRHRATSATSASVDADQPFFLYFATGACHSPHHAPAEWIERYRGQFDAGWDAWRDADVRPPASSWACCRRGTELSPRPPWVPAWDDLEPDDQRVAARFMECFAGFLVARRRADRPGARRSSSELGELDDTLVIARVRQRRELRGRAKGSINDARLWNGDARRPARAARARSTSSAARPRTTTTRGAGRWRATRRSSGGSARCTRAASPIRASCTGRTASTERGEIRHQFAHAIDVLPTVLELIGVDAPAEHRRRRRRRRSRARASRTSSTTPTPPERHTTQYFEMLGSRGIYHDGWKAVTFKPLGTCTTTASIRTRRSTTTCGSCTTSPTTCRSATTSRPQNPSGSRELVELWWDEARALPGAAARQPAARRAARSPRRAARTRDRYVFWPRAARSCPRRAGQRAQPSHTITADVSDEAAGERACCSPWARCSAAGRSTCSTAGSTTCTTTSGKERHVVERGRRRSRPAATSSRSASSRPGDSRARPTLLVDGAAVGAGRIARPHAGPLLDHRRRPDVRLGAGPPVGDRLRRAVPVHADAAPVVVDVDGVPDRDPEAEFDAIMSEQ